MVSSRNVSVRGRPTEIDLDPVGPWRWRVVVIGAGWVEEHSYRGPRWMAKRHVRRLFHRLQQS